MAQTQDADTIPQNLEFVTAPQMNLTDPKFFLDFESKLPEDVRNDYDGEIHSATLNTVFSNPRVYNVPFDEGLEPTLNCDINGGSKSFRLRGFKFISDDKNLCLMMRGERTGIEAPIEFILVRNISEDDELGRYKMLVLNVSENLGLEIAKTVALVDYTNGDVYFESDDLVNKDQVVRLSEFFSGLDEIYGG